VLCTATAAAAAALRMAAPAHLQGQLAGLRMMVTAVIGLGAGPALPGILAEHVFGGPAMLGPAIATSIAVSSLAAAGALVLGRRAYLECVIAQEESRPAPGLNT